MARAANQASLLVLGLSGRWPEEGLGHTRASLLAAVTTPVLVVRKGLRPNGLAPARSLTRFTWSLAPQG